jgi:hypothetical protein
MQSPIHALQNKITTGTKTKVLHFFEWNMACNSDYVPSTCMSYLVVSIKTFRTLTIGSANYRSEGEELNSEKQ